MIVPRYRVGPSRIPGAGQGLFLDQDVRRGSVVIVPDRVHTVMPEAQLREYSDDSIEARSSVRWFEDWFSITPEWSDECYVNHSFAPTGLWHLGFVFAEADLPAGSEITMDYRLVIGSGETMPFRDLSSGREIVGYPWPEALRVSAQRLLELVSA